MYGVGEGFVPPEGSGSKLFICAEAPGETEVEVGRPIVGRTGLMLRRAMARAGLGLACMKCQGSDAKTCQTCLGIGVKFHEATIFNTIQCRPPRNDYSIVSEEAVEYCKHTHHPKPRDGRGSLVLVGDKALRAYLPQINPITRWRGSAISLRNGWIAYPMLHPSYIVRGQWKLAGLLSADMRGARLATPVTPVKLITWDEFVALPQRSALALDVEAKKGVRGSIEIVGVSWDGIHVAQTGPVEMFDRLPPILSAAKRIYIHNARYDVVDQLEVMGIVFPRAKIYDTILAQALYQSDLEKGLDDALSITLAGRWAFHKALSGTRPEYVRLREQVERVWSRILGVELGTMDEATKARWYNALDVAGEWRLGEELVAIL